MEIHILDILSAELWTLISAIIFPTIAMIATFVSLRRAKLIYQLVGFFTVVPIFVALTVIFCGNTGNITAELLPPIGAYPIIGFFASVCFGIFCLNTIAIFCGRGVLKRKGAVLNMICTFICLSLNIFFTVKSYLYVRNSSFLCDDGKIRVRDALHGLSDFDFLPEGFLNSGIEIPILGVLIIFLIFYFLTFLCVKSDAEIRRDELNRRRRAALARGELQSRRAKERDDDDDSERNCCCYCERAERMKTDTTKMLCSRRGIVACTNTCSKFIYDPLKRKAFRPRITPLESPENLNGEDTI